MTEADRPFTSVLDLSTLLAAVVASGVVVAGWIGWHADRVALAVGHFECRSETIPRLTRIAIAWPPEVACVVAIAVLAIGAVSLVVARTRSSRAATLVARVALTVSLLVQLLTVTVVELGLRAGKNAFLAELGVPGVERCPCPEDFICVEQCPCQCACDADGQLRVILVDRDTDRDGHPDRRLRLDASGRPIR